MYFNGGMHNTWIIGLITAVMSVSVSCARAEKSTEVFRELANSASLKGESVIEGQDGWLFFMPELRHLGGGRFWGEDAMMISRANRADAMDPLPAILAFHLALKERGIELIMVPVPPKAVVYEEKLPGTKKRSAKRPDPHHQAFYALLRDEGITVVDLADRFRSSEDGDRGPLYCRQDTHWSGRACVMAAEQIAPHVRPLLDEGDNRTYDTEWRSIEISGDLWRMLDDPAREKETLQVRAVQGATPDPNSPVLVLGDSHTLVFQAGGDMHYSGAGLADQLAAELGRPVELIGVRGSGATPARINLFRRAQRTPDYWDNKRVVIWVFAAREFTESDGWRIVPIAP